MKEEKAARPVSALKIAGVYIGTVVGAGFASGQEMLQFFAAYGNLGYVGLFIVTLLFAAFGWIIMDLGYGLHATSYLAITRYAGGKWIGGFTDIIIGFFLFGGLAAMFAGTGAMLHQVFGLPPIVGDIFMAVLAVLTVMSGFSGVVNSISIVVPFLILSAVGVSIASFFVNPIPASPADIGLAQNPVANNWFLSSILYVSYNTVVSVAVLGPVGASARNKRAFKIGAVIGGLGLGVGALAIFLCIKANIAGLSGVDIPMLAVASRISPWMQTLYAIVLVAEIYTTAVGDLYGFAARVVGLDSPRFRWIVVATAVVALAFSQFGFVSLVRYLYPAVGYAGILFLLCLVFTRLRKKPWEK
jgi:uncharacterized membrane protein YkvI